MERISPLPRLWLGMPAGSMDIGGLAERSGKLTFGHAGVLAAPRKEGREVCCDPGHIGLMCARKSPGRCRRFCEVPAMPQALGWLRVSG